MAQRAAADPPADAVLEGTKAALRAAATALRIAETTAQTAGRAAMKADWASAAAGLAHVAETAGLAAASARQGRMPRVATALERIAGDATAEARRITKRPPAKDAASFALARQVAGAATTLAEELRRNRGALSTGPAKRRGLLDFLRGSP